MIHTTVGVYSSGDKVFNGVSTEDLQDHIDYNLSFRPGRAFFVDGKCLNVGYLTPQRCEELEKELKAVKMKVDTRPYQQGDPNE